MSECFDYIDGYDSAGQPIIRRQCYCGTTACEQEFENNFEELSRNDANEDTEVVEAINKYNYGNIFN